MPTRHRRHARAMLKKAVLATVMEEAFADSDAAAAGIPAEAREPARFWVMPGFQAYDHRGLDDNDGDAGVIRGTTALHAWTPCLPRRRGRRRPAARHLARSRVTASTHLVPIVGTAGQQAAARSSPAALLAPADALLSVLEAGCALDAAALREAMGRAMRRKAGDGSGGDPRQLGQGAARRGQRVADALLEGGVARPHPDKFALDMARDGARGSIDQRGLASRLAATVQSRVWLNRQVRLFGRRNSCRIRGKKNRLDLVRSPPGEGIGLAVRRFSQVPTRNPEAPWKLEIVAEPPLHCFRPTRRHPVLPGHRSAVSIRTDSPARHDE